MRTENVDIGEEELTNHFKSLFSPADPTDPGAQEYSNEIDANLNNEINRVKSGNLRHYVDPYGIAIIMKNLPNNKSPGHKGIQNEFFKYGHNTDLAMIVSKYLNLIINCKACRLISI